MDIPPIENLCLAGVVPVLPSLAEDEDEEGKLLNVNADTAAAAVAQALQAEKLVFLTDTPGILSDRNEPEQPDLGSDPRRVPRPDRQRRDRQGDDPQGRGLPELASRPGVRKTHIIDGRLRHSLLLEIFTESGIGTEIVNDENPDPRLSPGPAPRAGSLTLAAGDGSWSARSAAHAFRSFLPLELLPWLMLTLPTRARPRRSPSSRGT